MIHGSIGSELCSGSNKKTFKIDLQKFFMHYIVPKTWHEKL